MRLMYSGRDFVRLYEGCDQLSFLDAHVTAFCCTSAASYRGSSTTIRSAVAERIVGSQGS
jgi:hypothetical protein